MAITGPTTVSNLKVYTALAADGFPPLAGSADIITLLYITDTSAVWEYNGAGANWDLVKVGGVLVATPALAVGPTYFDALGLYEYSGEAAPGTALASSKWRVKRVTVADGQTVWADGNGNFDNLYTSLIVVSGLIYS